ncbi:MAG: hypothetical protein LAO79_13250 [Acidobacteriia bacterium]|nr:hypothetical protein [Terriglobia bacterium]
MPRLIALAFFAISAFAADPFYVGTWKIDSAVVGPWWAERQKPNDAEMKTLVGKTMVITAKSITGPRQVACRDPHFEVKDYPADMLFQGAFGEMHENDKSVDPAKAAAKAGFRGSSWKTLETGCANELDFHFLDPSTLAFGLNNYIYIVKKQP